MLTPFDRSVLLIACLFIALTFDAVSQPSLTIVNGQQYDWGTVREGDTLSYRILIRNDGTKTLRIFDATTSCGCTVAKLSKKLLNTGDSAAIEIRIDTKGISGRVKKEVFIQSNDPLHPKITVPLIGIVQTIIMVEPHYINFSRVTVGSKTQRAVTLVNTSTTAVKFLKVVTDDSSCTAVVSSKLLLPHEKAILTVTLLPSRRGKIVGQIHLKTNNDKQRQLSVSYIALSQ